MPQTNAPSEEQFGKRASGGLEPIEKPKPDPGVTQYKPTDGTSTPPAQLNPTLADRILISAERTKAIFRTAGITDATLYHQPDTTVWTAMTQNSETLTRITTEIQSVFTEIYGSEDLAAYMVTHLLPRGEREATTESLKYLRGFTGTPGAISSADPVREGFAPVGGTVSDASAAELVGMYLQNPAMADTWTPDQKAAAGNIAGEMLKSMSALPATGINPDIKRAEYIAATGDIRVALTADDVRRLEEVVRYNALGDPGLMEGLANAIVPAGPTLEEGFKVRPTEPLAGGKTRETPQFADIGVEQVRQLGEGVLVLNKEEAQSDPAKAYAIRLWAEQNYPGMQVKYGREGAVGKVVSAVSIPLDYLAAPFASGVRQLDELAEKATTSPRDRKFALNAANQLEEIVKDGDHAAYRAFLRSLGSAGETEVFQDIGFVDSEDWVSDAHRAIGHLRDMSSIDVGLDEFNRNMIQNTAPHMVGTGYAESIMNAADMLPGDDFYNLGFTTAAIQGATMFDPLFIWGPAVLGGLKAAAIIPKMRPANYAKYVESVRDLLLESRGGSIAEQVAVLVKKSAEVGATLSVAKATKMLRKAGALTPETAEATVRAAVRGTMTADAWYPAITRGWVKGGVYQMAARFPEEIAGSAMATRASKTMYHLLEAVGPDQFFYAVAKWADTHIGKGGTETAAMLADATSEADMRLGQMRNIMGMDHPGVNLSAWVSERLNIERELQAIGRVESARRDYLSGRLAWLNSAIDGREFIRPVRGIYTAKDLRQISRLAGAPQGTLIVREPIHRVIAATIDFAETRPKSFYFAMEHMFNPSGGGKVIVLPHVGRMAKFMYRDGEIVENLVEDSFGHMSNIGKTLGLSNKRVGELMGEWRTLEGRGANAGYDFLTKTWETMVAESPYLNAVGKRELKQMFKVGTANTDRAPAWLTLSQDAKGIHATAVAHNMEGVPKPVFPADMLTVWRTPSVEELRSYLTTVQRTMKVWEKAGGLRSATAAVMADATKVWTMFNNLWRTSVLAFRLAGALPLRIFNEQMLRIAAYDYASLVFHPIEWFENTRYGARTLTGAGDSALFLEHPGAALGVMVQNLERQGTYKSIRAGRNMVEITAPGGFEAAAVRIGKLHASDPVTGVLLRNLGDPEAAVRALDATDTGRDLLRYYDTLQEGQTGVVTNMMTELEQMIGTGAGSDKIRSLLRIGVTDAVDPAAIGIARTSVVRGGKVARHGTADLARELQRMYDEGEWVPGVRWLNPTAAEYVPTSRATGLRAFTDHLFEWAYSNPDLALSRGPLYRQIASAEFHNLMLKGYSPANARRLASAAAARGTADMMFTIGAKTSGEWFLKNISPFFPAWRELTTTWLKRIPLRIGEGHWALGEAVLARRAKIWYDFFGGIGVLREGPDGKPYIPLGFLGPMVRRLTGTNAKFEIGAQFSSAFGILPFPPNLFDEDLSMAERVKGVPPTFGAPMAAIEDLLNNVPGFKGILDNVEDWTTLTGADASLGPLQVDRMFEAFGMEAPWMSGTTADFHEAMQTWSIVDGMRIAWPDMIKEFGEPPNPNTDPAGAKDWAEDWLWKGRRYSIGMYLTKAIGGMTLPFSLTIVDSDKVLMNAMWRTIDALPEDGPYSSALINATITEFPNAEQYMTGKNIDTRTVDNPDETINEYMDAVKEGKVPPRSAEDWAVFHLYQHSQNMVFSKIDALMEGKTPAEFLIDRDAQAERKRLLQEWEYFRAQTRENVNWLPGQTQSAADMGDVYQTYQRLRDGERTPRLSFEEWKIMQVSEWEDEISKYFSPNPETSEHYYKLKDHIFALLDYEPSTELGRAQQWYFGEYQNTYYEKVDKLYDKAARLTNKDQDAGAVYDEIRAFSDSYNHPIVNPEHPEWGTFLSPEEHLFVNLSDKDQDRQAAVWADRPAEWLTAFQRSVVFPDLPEDKQDEASKLSALVTRGTRKLDAAAKKAGLDDQSTEVQNAEAALAGLYKTRAKEMGIEDYWAAANPDAPLYQKLDSALGLSQRTETWAQAERWAKEIIEGIEATPYANDRPPYTQFYSATGDSEPAAAARQLLIDRVARWRQHDEEFDKVMGSLQVSLGEEGKPLSEGEVVEKVFFNVTQISYG